MEVDQIADGLWRWTARHPDWTPEEGGPDGWEPEVGCIYYEAPDAVVLVDPLAPTDSEVREVFWRALDRDVEAAGRPVTVLLTVFWHERSAGDVLERYDGATLWANELALDRLSVDVTNPFRVGDALPGGVAAYDANRRDEVVLWIPEHRAVAAGDVLLGDAHGGVRVCPGSWLPEDVSPAEFREALRPLLELPIEHVLVSHGEPVIGNGREALARALGAQAPSAS